MSHDSTVTSFLRAISTAGLGITTGLVLSYPTVVFPSVFKVKTLSPRDRLHLWSTSFDSGLALMPGFFIPVTSLSLFLSAYLARPTPLYLPSNFFSLHRRSVLALAGSLVVAFIPYTLIFLAPVNTKLKDTEKAIIADPETNGKTDTDSLIQQWIALHWGRVGLISTALVLTLAEVFSA